MCEVKALIFDLNWSFLEIFVNQKTPNINLASKEIKTHTVKEVVEDGCQILLFYVIDQRKNLFVLALFLASIELKHYVTFAISKLTQERALPQFHTFDFQ